MAPLSLDTAVTIFSFLDPKNLLKCGKVCRTWREWSNHESLWKILAQTRYIEFSLPYQPSLFSDKQHCLFFSPKNYQEIVRNFVSTHDFQNISFENETEQLQEKIFEETFSLFIKIEGEFSLFLQLKDSYIFSLDCSTTYPNEQLRFLKALIKEPEFRFLYPFLEKSQNMESKKDLEKAWLENEELQKFNPVKFNNLLSLIKESGEIQNFFKGKKFQFSKDCIYQLLNENLSELKLCRKTSHQMTFHLIENLGWDEEQKEKFPVFIYFYADQIRKGKLGDLLSVAKTAEIVKAICNLAR